MCCRAFAVIFFCVLLMLQLICGEALIRSIRTAHNRVTLYAPSSLDLVVGPFWAEYDPSIALESLPYTVVTAPFIATIAPLVWLSGREYTIDQIDQDFFNSLEAIRLLLSLFYPQSSWNGRIIYRAITPTERSSVAQPPLAVLFSHGLDAIYTSTMHGDEKQLLITLWGCDICPSDTALWRKVFAQTHAYAQEHGWRNAWVRSNCAYFCNQNLLQKRYPHFTNWFAQVMQACAYLGLAFPIAYRAGCTTILLGSTRTQEYPAPFGTHPALDNLLACAGIVVSHDGAEWDRVSKIERLRDYCIQKNHKIPFLRVCWGNSDGGNCCRCEKCIRTIAELMVAGQEPAQWGFPVSLEEARRAIANFIQQSVFQVDGLAWHWHCIGAAAQKRLVDSDQCDRVLMGQLVDYAQRNVTKSRSCTDRDWQLYTVLWRYGMSRALNFEMLLDLKRNYGYLE